MKRKTILFAAEGTYPYIMGGVSTWSDQLIKGLPAFDFKIMTVVGPHPVEVAIDLPPNVKEVMPVHFWRPREEVQRPRKEHILRFNMLMPNLLSFSYGDVETFAQSLMMLARLGHDYDLWSLFENRSTWEIVRATLAELLGAAPRLGEVTLAINWLKSTLAPLLFIPPRTDVVHVVTNGLCAIPAYIAAKTYQVPMVLTEHGVYLRERYLGFKAENDPYSLKLFRSRFYETLAKMMYQHCESVTSVSHFNRYWQLEFGAAPERTRVIPNGIDPVSYPIAPVKHQDVPTIVWIGRVDPLKDLETLIRSFAKVREAIPNAKLRMFGPVPKGNESYHNRLKAAVTELSLQDSAIFEGPIRPAFEAYHKADVVVLSSISEGFPYTVVEAMMCARPVVSTRAGGVGDAIGDVGYLVQPRNPSALAEALVEVLKNPQLREALGARSRQRCLDEFTLGKMCARYGKLYEEVSEMPVHYQWDRGARDREVMYS
ncbi:MAG: GT4 family glycosyltransferase PelF [Deinococcales bacterium]